MDEHVRKVIIGIIDQEHDRSLVDWVRIEKEASAAIAYINEKGINVHNKVNNFLVDSDARKKSYLYAQHQTKGVLKFLQSI